jgi:peptidyl-prolyl cis-trans isomerase D
MFEVVRNNKRLAQGILAIVTVPFAFVGLEFLKAGAGDTEVARVGGAPIYQTEFDRAMRNQQDRLRRTVGAQASLAMLESDELRQAVLDNLVNNQMLARYAEEMRISVSAEQLAQIILQDPNFQEDGKFSPTRYRELLARQQMNPAMYEAGLAQDARAQQLVLSVGEATVVAKASVQRVLDAQNEKRVVREWRFPLAAKLGEVSINDEVIQKYYDDNAARFERPARVKAEYVVFDEAALRDRISVSEDEIRQSYDKNIGRYAMPEERHARHILIEVPEGADDAQVEAARRRIDDLAAQLRKSPARFAALAKEFSQDPGSKELGGDLGFIAREQMDQAFEDALFLQKKGDIGIPVRSSFGFHIIQVIAIREAKTQAFAAVHDEIAAELRKQAAGQRYAELAEKFSELVHEGSDSLESASRELGVRIQNTDWIERAAGGIGAYQSQELMNELFSPDSTEGHYNTSAVSVGVNALVAARVVEYESAQRLPLSEVKGAIETQLKREQAQRLSTETGAAALAALDKGETVAAKWGEPRTLQRGLPIVSPVASHAIFAAQVTTLPLRLGVELPGEGYAIYQIDSIERPAAVEDAAVLASITSQYARLLAERDFSAFLATLRARYKVKTHLPPKREE